jgi:hypothetical protein
MRFVLALSLMFSVTAFAGAPMSLEDAQQILQEKAEIPIDSPSNTPEVTAQVREAIAVVQDRRDLGPTGMTLPRPRMCCGKVNLGGGRWRQDCVPGLGICTSVPGGCGTASEFCR